MKQGVADGRVELRFGRSTHLLQNLRHLSVQGAGGSPHRDLLIEQLAHLRQHLLAELGSRLACTEDRRRVHLRYGMAGTLVYGGAMYRNVRYTAVYLHSASKTVVACRCARLE